MLENWKMPALMKQGPILHVCTARVMTFLGKTATNRLFSELYSLYNSSSLVIISQLVVGQAQRIKVNELGQGNGHSLVVFHGSPC